MMSARPSTSARQVAIIMVAGMMAATSAFQLPHSHHKFSLQSTSHHVSHRVRILSLEMASSGQDGGSKGTGKRKRRKRKKVEADSAPTLTATQDVVEASTTVSEQETDEKKQSAKAMAQQILAQEEMMFDDDDDDLTSFTPQKLEENDRIAAAAQRAGYSVSGGQADDGTQLEDFFDSREFLQRKREKQLEDASKEGKPSSAVPTKKKIKRSDIKAYTKLLEMDPIADEDDSYFEDEGIDVISALLGDVEPGVGNDSDESANKSGKKVQKRTSFLGIGSGPLQVGHTFGALSVILCAFVEYPGFPLTNLPDQLRGALQGGLATIYLINAVLAVFAFMEAPSRNQPSILWGMKTFAVGGIAYDQLMQIPTPDELVERARKEEELFQRRQGRRGKRQQK